LESNRFTNYNEHNKEKPLLVVRYSKIKLLGYLLFYMMALFLFGFGALYYTQQPDECYYEYLFYKTGFWVFTVMIIYGIIDALNTDRFEIYEDRLEKKVRFFKNFPLFGDKVVYFDTANFRFSNFGITICNCRFLLYIRGIVFNILVLPSKDKDKVAEILSQISGREKWRFKDLGRTSFVKKFKKSNKKGGLREIELDYF